mmetsp:Transcript_2700/g.4576  ORF Transcript_2700/g.4576 Transcript_2700/m.4576 type:complete len:92 (-) Transcript_2700:1038-1313(-)
MLVCHEGHVVNELYSKSSFRCDCGNSRLPESCQLNNEKDYENGGNRYCANHFDLYCYCETPFNDELVETSKVTGDLLFDLVGQMISYHRLL